MCGEGKRGPGNALGPTGARYKTGSSYPAQRGTDKESLQGKKRDPSRKRREREAALRTNFSVSRPQSGALIHALPKVRLRVRPQPRARSQMDVISGSPQRRPRWVEYGGGGGRYLQIFTIPSRTPRGFGISIKAEHRNDDWIRASGDWT